MEVIVLGSGAGGGIPQWNCLCPNCVRARMEIKEKKEVFSFRRTQSSIAVRMEGEKWILLNASIDLPTQLALHLELVPPGLEIRSSPFAAIILTDGQIDHASGLLSLREGKEIEIVCSDSTWDLISEHYPIARILSSYVRLKRSSFPIKIGSLLFDAFELPGGPPPYAKREPRPGDVIAVSIEDESGLKVVYCPALPSISSSLEEFIQEAECLFVDGTFWSENELLLWNIKEKKASEMGHIPVGGENGSLSWLSTLQIPKKIYIHINNTNPMLDPDSAQAKAVRSLGIEIAYDGMKLLL
ncbi:pyrroloquinoline quinone biosynthesis protein PqqB [Candidatus Methylacidiphilum fumarolicum]|uniref:Coenzyme PQQ synthesis protein B n=2 Tax=Candidatus Methylacidiphilum fumarolicum TaxID=591154 RepID=I0JZV5_METFB|nr:pyrroloquinoline quinone biosynthesis protein PqqB [Candidatus Methylacidiphilum fumarolicum]MBW6415805.1 pyrroloquinoline quinone biosynthesis protein PqqB [Candidatus Methylacidiphilum fumarolicum]TFE66291.1 pyrroloquinoline quinone biosynthesis protein B [Candidatus Methylacidiphilum fumarolicum]TFE71980.1 pyrroloquinoline quinone biosynthesis protein PqqB [Candidatus Methylacidiphilum fumarolicum]TFE73852.1 pyrroloquinoline quinone biosynthesis protein PqqB [Candidatus Methylacidiphilum 